jgi:hypothetical protein
MILEHRGDRLGVKGRPGAGEGAFDAHDGDESLVV